MHEQYFCMMSGSVRRKMKKLLSVNGQFITFITFMKTKTLQKDKVNIITLGCSKNMVDSEIFSGQLIANEIDVVHESAKKDHNIVVINTCGFIEKAKEESINTILQQVELKKQQDRFIEATIEQKKQSLKRTVIKKAVSTLKNKGITTNRFIV